MKIEKLLQVLEQVKVQERDRDAELTICTVDETFVVENIFFNAGAKELVIEVGYPLCPRNT